MRSGDRAGGPLAGLLVADFSRVLAGPLATMTLGDLGADVIKIERPGHGDDTRTWGPPFTDDGESAYYLAVNRNKRSLVLDLTDDRGVEVARRIAAAADVVIENFRGGTMDRFGLGFDAISAENPGVVYCRISGFGSGAGAGLPGYDFLVQALSGFMSITGEEGRPPLKTGVAIIDVLTGLNATVAILAALSERTTSGRGQLVEVDLFSSALAGLVNQASNHLNGGTVPTRMSNRHPNIAPYETLTTATAPIALAVGNDRQFRSLCEAIDRPALGDDPRFATNADRVTAREALVVELEAALRDQPAEHWVSVLREHGVPCGTVNDIAQAFALARSLGIDAVQTLARDDGTEVATVASPLSFSRTPVGYRLPPPTLGADTEDIIAWLESRSG